MVGVGGDLGVAVGAMVGSSGGKAVFVGARVAVGGTSVGAGVTLGAAGGVCVTVGDTLVEVEEGVLVASATVASGVASSVDVGDGDGAEVGSGARVGVTVWIAAPTEGGTG